MKRDFLKSSEIDNWFFQAEAYGYDASQKDESKRNKKYTLEEFFRATFPKEAIGWWKTIKKVQTELNNRFHCETDDQRAKLNSQFSDISLAEFMTAFAKGIFAQHKDYFLTIPELLTDNRT